MAFGDMSYVDVTNCRFVDPTQVVHRQWGPFTLRLQSNICQTTECSYFQKPQHLATVIRSCVRKIPSDIPLAFFLFLTRVARGDYDYKNRQETLIFQKFPEILVADQPLNGAGVVA